MSPGSAAPPLSIAILISGRGSNMVAIAEAARGGRLPVGISVVVSDQPQAAGLERAREFGLAREIVSHRPGQSREDYDRELVQVLRRHHAQLVVLAGFMRILSPAFVG
ncbi:MAG TPA: formyltransferase family protein, partial [Steroidobacteraceae bacterium]